MTTDHKDHGASEAERHGVKRSSHWPAVEKAHLEKHPDCSACAPGQHPKAKKQVHHIFPFHYVVALGRPDLELDDRNLITLCETTHDVQCDNHHLLLGHLDDFKSSNLHVTHDAAFYKGKSADELKGDGKWKTAAVQRLKPLDQMTQEEKQQFTALMNHLFPQKP